MNILDTPLAELEKQLGFKSDAPCIFCEQPVGALSMGGARVCPACDCGRYRQDHPEKFKRGKKWAGMDGVIFHGNARKNTNT